MICLVSVGGKKTHTLGMPGLGVFEGRPQRLVGRWVFWAALRLQKRYTVTEKSMANTRNSATLAATICLLCADRLVVLCKFDSSGCLLLTTNLAPAMGFVVEIACQTFHLFERGNGCTELENGQLAGYVRLSALGASSAVLRLPGGSPVLGGVSAVTVAANEAIPTSHPVDQD